LTPIADQFFFVSPALAVVYGYVTTWRNHYLE